ncbi:MAG: P1 family peptidase [bacterium]|nr:P1 family peptidase [bacterium]
MLWSLALAVFVQEPVSPPVNAALRARDLGLVVGVLAPGPLNAITDVGGVAVGHATIVRGEDVRTGVTVIVPRAGENTYLRKVPAAVYTGNGYGKAAGFTQVQELGEIESPIALTNTLSVGATLEAMVARNLRLPGNEEVRSVNVVVGETNDGWLNDIRGLHVRAVHVDAAWDCAARGPVVEGAVGAGTGTCCFGYKGGIGTSSRVAGRWTVGVLVQTNFGGRLRVDGRPFPPRPLAEENGESEDGSCMIVVATDAPLDARNLRRLAKRALLGLGRTGSVMSNGSGDYVIAFSTYPGNLIEPGAQTRTMTVLANGSMTPLFRAVVEATEESILNALVAARTTRGRDGHEARAIDHELLRRAAKR